MNDEMLHTCSILYIIIPINTALTGKSTKITPLFIFATSSKILHFKKKKINAYKFGDKILRNLQNHISLTLKCLNEISQHQTVSVSLQYICLDFSRYDCHPYHFESIEMIVPNDGKMYRCKNNSK